jgi:hypothetical protein
MHLKSALLSICLRGHVGGFFPVCFSGYSCRARPLAGIARLAPQQADVAAVVALVARYFCEVAVKEGGVWCGVFWWWWW